MYSKEEVRKKYDAFAKWYDFSEGILEIFLPGLRRELLKNAEGNVLEVGAGTGSNFKYYPSSCNLTATDFSFAMSQKAKKRAKKLGRKIDFYLMDTEKLSFPNDSFDTVVSSLSLCTYHNPINALKEMVRVCKTNGKILLLEHGASNKKWLRNYQNKKVNAHAKKLGCYLNRDISKIVDGTGLEVIELKRFFFGVFYFIRAFPIKL